MKITLDNMSEMLKKPDKKEVERISKRPKVSPFLKCFKCNIEQDFPVHCTRYMDYVNGQLVCEICGKTEALLECSKCKQPFGIGIKEIKVE